MSPSKIILPDSFPRKSALRVNKEFLNPVNKLKSDVPFMITSCSPLAHVKVGSPLVAISKISEVSGRGSFENFYVPVSFDAIKICFFILLYCEILFLCRFIVLL